MRLAGTRESLKQVEQELRDKNKKIDHLQAELHRKNKLLDQRDTPLRVDSEPKRDNYADLKKREKDLEKKIADHEAAARESKKYLQRLQELNSSLLAKIKQQEADKDHNQTEIDQLDKKVIRYTHALLIP